MQGKIIVQIGQIGETESFGENNFLKRETLVNTIEAYENHYKVEFQKDKTALLDNFKPGDLVEIKGFIQGRKYEKDGKVNVFMSFVGWSIEPYNSKG